MKNKFSYFSQVEATQEPSVPVRAVAGAALGGTLGGGAALLAVDKYEKYRNRVKPQSLQTATKLKPNWGRRALIGAGIGGLVNLEPNISKLVDNLQTKMDMLKAYEGIPIPQ